MTELRATTTPGDPLPAEARRSRDVRIAGQVLRLLRVRQWAKSVFVVVGPAYWLQTNTPDSWPAFFAAVALACAAFALASSGCYIFNDLADIEQDRVHPRKRHRPLAAGTISPGLARRLAFACFAASGVACLLLPWGGWPRVLLFVAIAAYVANVLLYSAAFKHRVIVDVMSLAMGFVLRVIGGCFAIGIAPSTWLLNVVFFLAMTLAFGKRLGERRSLGDRAADARLVQQRYSDDLLRMALVVTGVATLLTYAAYVTSREEAHALAGFNLLWLTMLPATFGLLRVITMVEIGVYDDPTELAYKDPPFQLAALGFALTTAFVLYGAPLFA